MKEFQVRKDNFTAARVIEIPSIDNLPITSDEIVVKIDHFAYTSNNITYAVAGNMIGYWQFFPPKGEDAKDWGIIPVWGFADVVKSELENIPVGDRLFGYFPPATYLKMKPLGISDNRFIDGTEHRAALPAGYNIYRRTRAEPDYSKAMDNARMLLYPLHLTSFCLWDLLKDKNWYGAEQILLLSASSKTSIGLAYALHMDESAPKVIGLTSKRNVEMVGQLGFYQETVPYEAYADIDASRSTIIIDMSGNLELLKSLYHHFGDYLKYCINVGLTHWDQAGAKDELLSQKSEFFFAPGHIQKRIKEWGSERFEQESSAFLQASMLKAREWLNFQKVDGLDGLHDIHEKVCKGLIEPDKGLIVDL